MHDPQHENHRKATRTPSGGEDSGRTRKDLGGEPSIKYTMLQRTGLSEVEEILQQEYSPPQRMIMHSHGSFRAKHRSCHLHDGVGLRSCCVGGSGVPCCMYQTPNAGSIWRENRDIASDPKYTC